MWITLLAPALAAGLHTGIPLDHGIEGLGAPSLQTSKTGWTADFKKGLVRVYVGATEEAAARWTEDTLELIARQKPKPMAEPFADASWGDGHGLMLWREGNIGVLVQCTQGARLWSELLHGAISDAPLPPLPPAALEPQPAGGWLVRAHPEAKRVDWQGGRRLPGHALAFSIPPDRVVVWDDHGRATVQRFGSDGQALAEDPPQTRATVRQPPTGQ